MFAQVFFKETQSLSLMQYKKENASIHIDTPDNQFIHISNMQNREKCQYVIYI